MDQSSIKLISVHTVKPDLVEFPIPELLQLMDMNPNLPQFKALFKDEDAVQNQQEPYDCRNRHFKYWPFTRLNLPKYENYPEKIKPNDPLLLALNQVVDRAVLTQAIILVLAEGHDYKDLLNNVPNQDLLRNYTQDPDQLINFQVFSGNRCITKEEQVQAIDWVTDAFDLKGNIDIKKANTHYWLCEYHEPFETNLKPDYKETLKKVYFGVQIAYNRKNRSHYVSKYDLPNRAYLGPTSTSAPLAFVMANMAQIKEFQTVLDPFVGTGGLLVPAAHHGATTFGSDIDARVIHGHGVGHLNKACPFKLPENPIKPFMFYSFFQYGFQVPELVRQDCLKSGFKREFFDAVICDPPYGIRAVSRATGQKKRAPKDIEDKSTYEETKQQTQELPLGPYIIPTKKIDHLEIYDQLFEAAARMLKSGGLLTYLYPFDRENGPATVKDIPIHQKFKLINFSEEGLTLAKSRILITMRKI